jgi:hypothetical protein
MHFTCHSNHFRCLSLEAFCICVRQMFFCTCLFIHCYFLYVLILFLFVINFISDFHSPYTPALTHYSPATYLKIFALFCFDLRFDLFALANTFTNLFCHTTTTFHRLYCSIFLIYRLFIRRTTRTLSPLSPALLSLFFPQFPTKKLCCNFTFHSILILIVFFIVISKQITFIDKNYFYASSVENHWATVDFVMLFT